MDFQVIGTNQSMPSRQALHAAAARRRPSYVSDGVMMVIK